MPDLGTISTNDLHPKARVVTATFRDRSGPANDLHPRARGNILGTPDYANTYAHYPVRLNGRECHLTTGPNAIRGWPWTAGGLPWSDANGRIIHFAGKIEILWSVTAGARQATIKVRHNCVAGPAPRVILSAPTPLGVAEQVHDVPGLIDTEHIITINASPLIAGTITISLVQRSAVEGENVTWGEIATT